MMRLPTLLLLRANAQHIFCIDSPVFPMDVADRSKTFLRVYRRIRAYMCLFLLLFNTYIRRMGNIGNKQQKTSCLLAFCVLPILLPML